MTDIFKKKLVKRAGRHFGFFKRAGRHEKGAGRRALQTKPRQNTAIVQTIYTYFVMNIYFQYIYIVRIADRFAISITRL